MTLLGIIGSAELVIILFVGLFLFLLPLLAIVDIIRSKFEGNMQLIWVIVVYFSMSSVQYFILLSDEIKRLFGRSKLGKVKSEDSFSEKKHFLWNPII